MAMTNKNMRVEKDFLGAKELPIKAYYGIQTLRAVENFPITGYKIHESLIKAFAIVKKAAALANTDVGRLELNKGGAIAEAAQ
ncbi:aspartate ammonia-lyase, partial [Bacillus cereus]